MKKTISIVLFLLLLGSLLFYCAKYLNLTAPNIYLFSRKISEYPPSLKNKFGINLQGVKDKQDNYYIQALTKDNFFIVSEVQFPPYLYTPSDSWNTQMIHNKYYSFLYGCYEHDCETEHGVLIYDFSKRRFFLMHYVISTTSEDSLKNTLDGQKLEDDKNYINFPLGRPDDAVIDTVLSSDDFSDSLSSASETEFLDEGRLCGHHICDGGNKPLTYRDPNEIPPIEENLISYKDRRKELIKQKWKPIVDTSFPPTSEYPELSCGNASCSAAWKKGKRELFLEVSTSEKVISEEESVKN